MIITCFLFRSMNDANVMQLIILVDIKKMRYVNFLINVWWVRKEQTFGVIDNSGVARSTPPGTVGKLVELARALYRQCAKTRASRLLLGTMTARLYVMSRRKRAANRPPVDIRIVIELECVPDRTLCSYSLYS